MIGVESDFDTGYAALLNTTGNYAFVHDCGFIVFSPSQPNGCMECRSHLRHGLSNHGEWHRLYIRFEEGS